MGHPIDLNITEQRCSLTLSVPSHSDDALDFHFRGHSEKMSITDCFQSNSRWAGQFVRRDVLARIVEHPEWTMVDDVDVLAHLFGRFIVFGEK